MSSHSRSSGSAVCLTLQILGPHLSRTMMVPTTMHKVMKADKGQYTWNILLFLTKILYVAFDFWHFHVLCRWFSSRWLPWMPGLYVSVFRSIRVRVVHFCLNDIGIQFRVVQRRLIFGGCSPQGYDPTISLNRITRFESNTLYSVKSYSIPVWRSFQYSEYLEQQPSTMFMTSKMVNKTAQIVTVT